MSIDIGLLFPLIVGYSGSLAIIVAVYLAAIRLINKNVEDRDKALDGIRDIRKKAVITISLLSVILVIVILTLSPVSHNKPQEVIGSDVIEEEVRNTKEITVSEVKDKTLKKVNEESEDSYEKFLRENT